MTLSEARIQAVEALLETDLLGDYRKNPDAYPEIQRLAEEAARIDDFLNPLEKDREP